MSQQMYLEDFYVGQKIQSAVSPEITAEEIKEFAAKYDPQPFHLDEAAAENSFFKGLAASGWMTAAITMSLRVKACNVAGGMIGAGVEEMRWTAPVRPGDTLHAELEILNVRTSKSRPELGIVRARTTTFNQHDKPVLETTVNFMAPVKAALK